MSNDSASLTVVVVTAGRLVRADFGGVPGQGPSQVWTAARHPGSRLHEGVRAALSLAGRPARRVVVLGEDFWAQSASLTTAQTAGLQAAEIAAALAFELEPFTSVPPEAGVLAYWTAERRGGTAGYWVVQSRRDELAALRDVVAASGGRLVAASHPAGLPSPVGAVPPGAAWQRVEVWQRGAVQVTGGGAGGVAVASLASGEPAGGSGGEGGVREWLTVEADDPAAPSQAGPWPSYSLADGADLRRWLTAWAACVDGARAGQVALLTPPPAPVSVWRYVLVAAALEGAVGLACLGHRVWFNGQRQRLERDLAVVRESLARVGQAEQQRDEARRTLDVLVRENHDREAQARRAALERRAHRDLLRTLAAVRPEGVTVLGIASSGPHAVRIGGISLQAGGANELASRLSREGAPDGWRARLVRSDAGQCLDNGGPWHFTLESAWGTEPHATVPDPAAPERGEP